MALPPPAAVFPTPLSSYPPPSPDGILQTLGDRLTFDLFNGIATAIFLLAIAHTFLAPRIARIARVVQHAADARARAAGRPAVPSIRAEFLHFLGEVEAVFGLWAVVLVAAITIAKGWGATTHYFNEEVIFTEALFVVVIMTLASTRPVISLAERSLRAVAELGGGTPAAWWLTILTIGPLLGSFITEPAAMTISAVLLGRQFFDLQPGVRLKYATLGVLFVNVSVGGTLTHFAAPPVLIVAGRWGWDTSFMLSTFGWRSALAVITSNVFYYAIFRRELAALAGRPPVTDEEQPDEELVADGGRLLPVPAWVTAVHVAFMGWTVFTAHYPALFLGAFLFFIGFAKVTAAYQGRLELRAPLLVGFFLGGLVIHGTLQRWWIAPILTSLPEHPLYVGAAVLTAFNDNALITYLSTLVPDLGPSLKVAVVQGAVTGGGLTVIANAPNPAGQALLARFFGGAVSPLHLLLGALVPTLIAAAAFRLI
jgi:hypothetical protein